MARSQPSDPSALTSAQAANDHYDALHGQFGWQVDEFFNISQACCARWAEQDARLPAAQHRMAVRQHLPNGPTTSLSFVQLQRSANALSQVLRGLGVQRGDRVAIVLPQCFETAVAYMAVLQMGAVAMPLSILFGPEALEYRLRDSRAVVAIADQHAVDALRAVRGQCPALRNLLLAGTTQVKGDPELAYESALAGQASRFTAVKTRAEDAAILIYTSGTTGPPKGALLPHRALIGNLPGFVCSQNWFGFDADCKKTDAVFWSPADWAWTGGLMDALLPSLYFGRPIVAYAGRFSPEAAFALMAEHGVTHTFLFPTALKAMMKAFAHPRQQFDLRLQAIMSAGEAVGDAVFAYCQNELGVTVNEMFGQTEINYIVGNCAMQWGGGQGWQHHGKGRGWLAKPGSMGKPYPGHRVAVIDEQGRECAVGVPGDVAVHRFDLHGDPDPIFFSGYWNNDAATQGKFTGDWCRTGDLARRDADGYLWYDGRADDVFKAAGYRIGPGEIENCLVKHPAVANAAVVPKPDAERGALVKAYVVLLPDFQAQRQQAVSSTVFDTQVQAQLQAHVKSLLAPYEYPKEVEFIDALPMTTTGKVQRRVLRLQEEERWRVRNH